MSSQTLADWLSLCNPRKSRAHILPSGNTESSPCPAVLTLLNCPLAGSWTCRAWGVLPGWAVGSATWSTPIASGWGRPPTASPPTPQTPRSSPAPSSHSQPGTRSGFRPTGVPAGTPRACCWCRTCATCRGCSSRGRRSGSGKSISQFDLIYYVLHINGNDGSNTRSIFLVGHGENFDIDVPHTHRQKYRQMDILHVPEFWYRPTRPVPLAAYCVYMINIHAVTFIRDTL